MKSVSPAMKAALLGGAVRTVYLCQIDHPTGMVYLNSGILPVTWNGQQWTALGTLGTITGMAQSRDAKSQQVTLTLAAPQLDAVAQDIISQSVAGRQAWVWQAFFTEDWQVIADPLLMADVTMDSLEVVIDDGGRQSLQIQGFMTQFAARRVMPVYYSNEEQQARFPGDTGMDRIAELADKVI
jgi:hypothetical protein